MINEQFPKLNPNNKTLGDRDWFQLPCTVLAQALWQLCFYFISRILAYHLLLKLSFVSVSQGIIMVVPPWMGTLLETGIARAVSGKSHQEEPPSRSSKHFAFSVPVSFSLFCYWWLGPLTVLRQEERLPILHSEVLVMPGWSPGLLSSSVCSSMPHP